MLLYFASFCQIVVLAFPCEVLSAYAFSIWEPLAPKTITAVIFLEALVSNEISACHSTQCSIAAITARVHTSSFASAKLDSKAEYQMLHSSSSRSTPSGTGLEVNLNGTDQTRVMLEFEAPDRDIGEYHNSKLLLFLVH